MVEMKPNNYIRKMIINFFYKFFFAISFVFLLLSVYLNISKMVSDDTMGSSYMVREKINDLAEGHIYSDIQELEGAYESGHVDWHATIKVRIPSQHDSKEEVAANFVLVQTTVGRALANNFLTIPEGLTEMYDEKIAKIDNFNDLKKFVDYEIKENNFEGIDIPIYIDDVVRRKYFHQTAYIAAETNWLLRVADYFFPERLFLTAMDPTDLVKKNHSICSQQSIIFQELIKDYKFEYASIRFDIKLPDPDRWNFGHFASTVKVGGDWFFFDSNMEPVYDRKDSLIYKKILAADKEILTMFYPTSPDGYQFNFDLLTKEMINFSDLNRFPAKRGVMFQKITQFFSDFSWFLFLIFSLLLRSLSFKLYVQDK